MNKDKIVAVLEAEQALVGDSLVSSVKRCGHAGRCAIGALLFAEGVTDAELWRLEERHADVGATPDEWWEDESPRLGKTYGSVLEDGYGLSEGEAGQIVVENDGPSCSAFREVEFGGVSDWKRDRIRARCVIDFVRNEL